MYIVRSSRLIGNRKILRTLTSQSEDFPAAVRAAASGSSATRAIELILCLEGECRVGWHEEQNVRTAKNVCDVEYIADVRRCSRPRLQNPAACRQRTDVR